MDQSRPRHYVTRRSTLIGLLVLVVVPSIFVRPAVAAPTWAPAPTATIHPGVLTQPPIGQCTANFVFFSASDVFLGSAAHCFDIGVPTNNGCGESMPLGTEVQVQGATQPAVLAYSSWLAMQVPPETDDDVCAFNDFALLRLDPTDVGRVNPSIPFWGGPTGLDTNGAGPLEQVYSYGPLEQFLSYGNSSLTGGLTQLSPRTGINVQEHGSGWSRNVLMLTPGGDSGSAFLSSQGQALGVLQTLVILPPARAPAPGEPLALPASNRVSDISRALAYAQAHGQPGVQLAGGTEPFRGGVRPPIDLGLPIDL